MKTKIKKTNDVYEQILKEKDPVVHRKAIEKILSGIDLDEQFLMLIEEKDGVRDFFLLWTRAWKEEKDPKGKRGLRILAESSKKFYEGKDYRKLCGVFYDIIFRQLADFIHLREREDFETITDFDLHSKNLIPSEIFLQYSFMEIMVKSPSFDWDRGEEIANQSLAFFITYFSDMIEFFYEDEEKSEEKTRCGLCGKSGNLQKTDCCDNWICNDSNEYVVFSYARNSCSRNHNRFTLCGYHKNEGHKGVWKTCKKCPDDMRQELEMYVWYGTNEYNFTKLENPPKFKPTYCSKCKKHIILPDGGYSVLGGEYSCEDCPITDKERNGRISMSKSKK